MLSNSLAGQEGINYFSSAYSSFQSLSIAKEIAAGRFTPFSEQIRSSFSMIPGANRTVIFLPSAIKPPPRHDTIFLKSCQCRNNGNLPLSVTCHLSPMGGCRSTPPIFQRRNNTCACPGKYYRCPPFFGCPGVVAVPSRGPGAPPLRSGLRRPSGPPRRASARVARPPSPRGRSRLSWAGPAGPGISFESGWALTLVNPANPLREAHRGLQGYRGLF